jgi:hypothetical protein
VCGFQKWKSAIAPTGRKEDGENSDSNVTVSTMKTKDNPNYFYMTLIPILA